MDPKTVELLERRMEEIARARGDVIAPDDGQPLYLQDLEARAKKKGLTVDEVYRRDSELLSRARPTPDCLRAEEIMQAALDAERLPKRDYEHLQGCVYCRAQAAASVPDARRHAAMMEELAGHEPPPVPAVVRRTEAFFLGLDRFSKKAIDAGSKAAAACLVVVMFTVFVPSTRLYAPPWAWTDGQLQSKAEEALKAGDPRKAEELASRLILRDQSRPAAYLLRAQSWEGLGMTKRAVEDRTEADKLYLSVRGGGAVVEQTGSKETRPGPAKE